MLCDREVRVVSEEWMRTVRRGGEDGMRMRDGGKERMGWEEKEGMDAKMEGKKKKEKEQMM